MFQRQQGRRSRGHKKRSGGNQHQPMRIPNPLGSIVYNSTKNRQHTVHPRYHKEPLLQNMEGPEVPIRKYFGCLTLLTYVLRGLGAVRWAEKTAAALAVYRGLRTQESESDDTVVG